MSEPDNGATLNTDDYRQALKSMDSFIDVSVDDLMTLTTRAKQFARLRVMTAGDIASLMSQPVATVHPHTSLQESAYLLVSRRISGMPVVDDDNRLKGIITEADFLRVLGVPPAPPIHSLWHTLENLFTRLSQHGGQETADESVATHMVSHVITATPTDSVQTVLNLMKRHQVRRVVIVDDARRVCGIVTRSNLVKLFLDK
jgi:CBS-domain-containing membrane protein